MHTIKIAARDSGLSQHTIRAWERRYNVLSPERTPTNRRLYSDADIEKLSLLREAVSAGHSIGQLADLEVGELRRLAAANPATVGKPSSSGTPGSGSAGAGPAAQGALTLDACLYAVEKLDASALEDTLTDAAALLGSRTLIDRVLQPLLERIGEQWRGGEIRPAHEHMATAVVRTLLGRLLEAYQPAEHAPRLVVTTPVGQIHELGALIAAVTAASEGWRVVYLGPNLPSEEIAGAALQSGARAVALSLVYPPDDPRVDSEIRSLGRYLGHAVPVIAGGRASLAYRQALESIGALQSADLTGLRSQLEALRSG